jgi:hypothetical protein
MSPTSPKPPITILVVDKTGTVKECKLKSYDEKELYKKAGFKTADDFKLRAQWNINNDDKKYCISVYGKVTGRANQENKYDFPPPIDTTLMFGSCIIVNKNSAGEPVSISEDEWDTVYEFLFGGFDDLDDKDSDDDEDEDDEDDGLPRTKEGYIKDGFIVDDDEDDEDDEDYEEDEEEDEFVDDEEDEVVKPKAKRTRAPAKPKASDKKKKGDTIFNKANETRDCYLDCTSELDEEDYL